MNKELALSNSFVSISNDEMEQINGGSIGAWLVGANADFHIIEY